MDNKILDDDFFNSFCKVEFLCYQGDPNWLGWIFVIIFVAFALSMFFVSIGAVLFVIYSIFESIFISIYKVYKFVHRIFKYIISFINGDNKNG